MIESLLRWLGIGLAAALAGAALFALGISRPILRITETALRVAKGDLAARVRNVRSRDEIGDLATRFNDMIVQLNERFELQKFVSRGTMQAIQDSDHRTVSLGGERRRVAVLFADIRGYTAFSESRSPEEVVAVLNSYFQQIADLVVTNHGDIDKFVGDQIMAVFDGERMTRHAVQCAIDIMNIMEALAAQSGADLSIGIGVNVGEVVVGAMGSRERKDFTVLGDHVNLSARLCSSARPDRRWCRATSSRTCRKSSRSTPSGWSRFPSRENRSRSRFMRSTRRRRWKCLRRRVRTAPHQACARPSISGCRIGDFDLAYHTNMLE